MNINLYNLQKSVIEDYNSIVELCQEGYKDVPSGLITLDADKLEKRLRCLHNSLAIVAALRDNETKKAYLDSSEVKMLSFHFDADDEDDSETMPRMN